LDAQANLASAFLDEDALEGLWETNPGPTTVYRAIKPLTQVGDIQQPVLQKITENLRLVPGDVALAAFEDTLSEAWPASMGDASLYRPFRILTAFLQVAQMAANEAGADLILADVGPNLGAINRLEKAR
jgi:cellulose biosynthesis protein BcsQ